VGNSNYLQHLSIQVSSQKTRPPSQTPGAWAGRVAVTGDEGVGVRVPQDKWEKALRYSSEILSELQSSNQLDRKFLESVWGFYIHLQCTYPSVTPYIKGLHLTINGWQGGRDEDMWKVNQSWDGDGGDPDYFATPPSPHAPARVTPAPRLRQDMQALHALFSHPTPPIRYLRPRRARIALYGFVDASGSGFGGSYTAQDGRLLYRHGIWGRDADHVSSNYKELRNLVDTVEEGTQSGELHHSELFIFTDNSTAEGAYYKGNTNSKLLFDLVLRLRQLDMGGLLRLHITHVAGTRMVAQGADGLSRGDLTEGIMQGASIESFIPLHLSALDRLPALLSWVQSWCPMPSITLLAPNDWFERGHGILGGHVTTSGTWHPHETHEPWLLWTPAPAAASTALDELQSSRHKCSHLNHIFICPRLFTQAWRRKLHRVADIVIELPAGCRPVWPLAMHEPLLIGLTLHLAACYPWHLRVTPQLLDLDRALHGVWRDPQQDEGPLLRQLCLLPGVLDALS